MSQQTEASVLEFISRAANPYVTLSQLRAHVGDSSFGVAKIHLGALTRKKYIQRANFDQDVIYWTASTNKLVEALLVKPIIVTPIPSGVISSSPYAKKPVEHAAPERTPKISFTVEPARPLSKPEPTLPPVMIGGVRVAQFALQKRPQKIYMGNLRRNGLNGVVAMAMYAHRGRSFTPESVNKMCPEMVLNDVRRVLNHLCQGDRLLGSGLSYLKRSLTSPFVYRWSELFEYPFSERLEGDGALCVTVDIAGWTSSPSTAFYDDDPQRAEEYEATLRAFDEAKTPHGVPVPVRDASVRVPTPVAVPEPVAEVEVEPATAAVAEEVKEEVPTSEGAPFFDFAKPALANIQIELKADSPVTLGIAGEVGACCIGLEKVVDSTVGYIPTEAEAKHLSKHVYENKQEEKKELPDPAAALVPNFDASINLAGELTLFLKGTPVKLSRNDTRCLVALIGPHYVSEQHRLLAKPKF